MKSIRKISKMIAGGMMLLPLLISCQIEDDVLTQTEDTTIANTSLALNPQIEELVFPVISGMLQFEDLDQLKETVAFLEKEVISYDDQFLSQHKDLEPQALEDLETAIDYNPNLPLVAFANANNFQSLFLKQQAAEQQWLAQPELDLATDPDNHFVEDDELQAVLNELSEVMIGEAIYKMMDFGYLIITDGDLATLERIRQNPEVLEYDNVEIIGDYSTTRAAGCSSSKAKSGFKPSGSYRIKWKISHRTPITGRRVKCTTKNYKKKKNRWKKARAYTLVKPYGYISDAQGRCDNQLDFNPDNLYSDRYNKFSWSWRVLVATKTKSGWVKGYHKGIAGITHDSVLTW